LFPRADFPWVCRLHPDTRTLELWEYYELTHSLHFDADGRGPACECASYWELSRTFPTAWPEPTPGRAPTALTGSVLAAIHRAFGGAPASPLFAAPREHAETVSILQLGELELWLPDAPLAEGGALALRDATGLVGFVDLRDFVTPDIAQQLLAHGNPDLDLRVLDDHSTYRTMRVVASVTSPEMECTLDEAHEVDADAALGAEVFWPMPLEWASLVLHWIGRPHVLHGESSASA